jgi:hypothetical protein
LQTTRRYDWMLRHRDPDFIADQWLGACELSEDAFDAYREAFQTVLEDWRDP